MKLSDAIRLGAMLNPQGFGSYVTSDGGTCALGAAVLAGYRSVQDDINAIALSCPARRCHRAPRPLCQMVIHLNDDHEWTRERIADWVATVEPASQEVAPQVDECALSR